MRSHTVLLQTRARDAGQILTPQESQLPLIMSVGVVSK